MTPEPSKVVVTSERRTASAPLPEGVLAAALQNRPMSDAARQTLEEATAGEAVRLADDSRSRDIAAALRAAIAIGVERTLKRTEQSGHARLDELHALDRLLQAVLAPAHGDRYPTFPTRADVDRLAELRVSVDAVAALIGMCHGDAERVAEALGLRLNRDLQKMSRAVNEIDVLIHAGRISNIVRI